MENNNKLSTPQIIIRALFFILSVGIVTYFFPQKEAFKYEYELGKPWKYNRLTAQYDYPIYRSDSVMKMLEDSLRRQMKLQYTINTNKITQLRQSLNIAKSEMEEETFDYLSSTLGEVFGIGILSEKDKDELMNSGKETVAINEDGRQKDVNINDIKSEKEVYLSLISDTIYGKKLPAKVRDYISVCLTKDTTAMAQEYAQRRKNISATKGTVLAYSRIVDQGEIISPEILDKLESYRIEREKRMENTANETLMLIGRLLLVALILGSIQLFLFLYRPWIHLRQVETLVAVGSVVFMIVMTAIASRHLVGGEYLVPIGIVTIVLATFHGSRTAYFCHIVMALLCSFMAQAHFEYLMLQFVVGMVIIFNLKDGLNDRSQLLRISILTAATYCILYCIFILANEGTLVDISLRILSMMICNALLLLMSYIIIYAFEKTFHFMSGVTLMELCNLNVGLLDRLAKEAPGTFEHSLHVSNISANAAKVIKANAQLVRTGALYHDIGKLWNPIYYTENQMGANPHNNLPVEESVKIIKKHVSEGLAMAKKAKLPVEIQEFIGSHHGKGLIKYFYTTWCNQHPEAQPDVSFFSYNGEDPKTKEQAILMMADGVEAASKSLKETSEETITSLVNKIVESIVTSGRLNHSKITLHEIELVKESFIKDLMGIYHSRIAYPELKTTKP